jgi:hypothetical protein
MTEIADPASSPRVSGSEPSARIVHGPVSPADPVDSAARGSRRGRNIFYIRDFVVDDRFNYKLNEM